MLSRWAVLTKAELADLRAMKARAEEMKRRHADPDIFTEAWHCARYILEGNDVR